MIVCSQLRDYDLVHRQCSFLGMAFALPEVVHHQGAIPQYIVLLMDLKSWYLSHEYSWLCTWELSWMHAVPHRSGPFWLTDNAARDVVGVQHQCRRGLAALPRSFTPAMDPAAPLQ